MGLFDADPNRSVNDLLKDISAGAAAGSNTEYIGYAVPPFAALLVRLSRDAEATAHKLVVLTRWLIGLTIALIALTALIVGKDIYQLYKNYHQTNEAPHLYNDPQHVEPALPRPPSIPNHVPDVSVRTRGRPD